VTLTAPPGKLKEYLDAWKPGWEDLGDPRRPLQQPVWVLTISNHEAAVPGNQVHPFKADHHIHIVVGNLPYQDLYASLSSWKGGRMIQRIYNRWGILHYILTQDKGRHALDILGHVPALLCPPLCSDNLELYERKILAERAWDKSQRSKKAVNTRWAKQRQQGPPVEPNL